MAVDQSCKITNNSGKAVVVLDAYTSATSTAQSTPQQGYQQDLKALPLTGGGQTLANGATGTVTLNDTRTDSTGKSAPNYVYQLLLSDPATLAPVTNAGETVSFKTSPWSYPEITATAAAAKNMGLAVAFCQNIMAYPSSTLATGFVTAMNAAQQQSSVTAMMSTIATYFNTTKGYQGVDFPSYVAASTYITSYAYAFGLGDDATPGRTYWLYASSDASGPGNSSSGTSHGKIVFTRKTNAPSPADPADRNSGFTIEFTPASGSAKALTLSGGQYLDDTKSDTPAVALAGSYALRSQFTKKSDDTGLWPILIGMVDGVKVIGVSMDPADNPAGNSSPITLDTLIDWFLKAMGLWMALDFIKSKLSAKDDKLKDAEGNENEGKAPTQEQVSEIDTEVNADAQAQVADFNEAAAKIGSDVELNAEQMTDEEFNAQMDALVEQVRNLGETANDNVAGDNYQAQIDEYGDNLGQLAEIGVNDSLEDAMGQLGTATDALPDATSSGEFSSVSDSLAGVKSSMATAIEELPVGQELAAQLQESQTTIDDWNTTSEESSEAADGSAEGESPVEDFEPVEF